MLATFGKQPETMPAGYFKAVRFPTLALLDTETGDGRLLDSAGAGVRNLPMTIRGQFRASSGHEGADVTGAVFEVTIDPENGKASGRGFLLNDPNGRTHARMIATQAMDRNSVDLADVTARFEEDLATGDYRIRFTKYNFAATTGVATPAFAEAYAEVDPLTDEEMMASLIGDDPMDELVADCPFVINLDVPAVGVEIDEVTASGIVQPFEAFYRPESDHPQKIVVDENGDVFGHLGVWESCHDGIEGRCVRIPRPTDNYASFNKAGVLTDRGIVETGPIFAYGGHKRGPDLEQAYGGIENAWCDVRISVGVHGPWISGRVRPGVDEHTTYACRASRISGHWLAGRLKAIVSVNAEGFDVPGSGDEHLDLAASFAFSTDADGVAELVASFPSCMEPAPPRVQVGADGFSVTFLDPIVRWDPAKSYTTTYTTTQPADAPAPVSESAEAASMLLLLLEDDD